MTDLTGTPGGDRDLSPDATRPLPTTTAPTPGPSIAPPAERSGGGVPPRFDLGRVVGGLVLVALGALWLADATGAADVRAALVLPILLTVVGVGLMVGSVQGSHPALVTVGVLLAVATVFSALSPPEALRGGVGSRRYVVTGADQLRSRYQVGLGDLTLDLSALELDRHRTVNVDAGAGDVTIIVPSDVTVTVEARVGAGEVVLFGEEADGLAVERSYRAEGSGDGALTLDLELGAGRIEVQR